MNELLKQRILLFVSQSNAIEDIYVSVAGLQNQLARGEEHCHVGALVYADNLSQSHTILEERHIHEVQRRIVFEQNEQHLEDEAVPSRWCGAYRTVGVRVGGYIAPRYQDIPMLMQEFFQRVCDLQKRKTPCRLRKEDALSVVEEIANIHYEFLAIHPYVDGNGRTGRAIVWFLFRFFGLSPIFFTAKDRWTTYYPACKEENLMREYFLSRYQK